MKQSTNNAFTGSTNSINWKPKQAPNGAIGLARKNSGVYLENSRQQQAYSAAGKPK